MKAAAVLISVLICSASFASFELALIADPTNGVIHRYDLSSRIYLGSFGSGWFANASAPVSLAVDQSRGIVYATDSLHVRKFNYNTGEYLGVFGTSSPTNQLNLLNDGRIAVSSASSSNASVYNPDGTLWGTILRGSTNTQVIKNVDQLANGIFVQMESSVGAATSQFFSRSTESSSPVSSFSASAYYYDMSASGQRIAWIGGSNGRLFQAATITSVGSFSGPTSTFFTRNVATDMQFTGVAWGHNDPFAVSTNGTASQLIWNDLASQTLIGVNLPSQIVNARDIAIVTAPEPASMAALGFGLAALIRRRRSSR